jgi:hypothetical protein
VNLDQKTLNAKIHTIKFVVQIIELASLAEIVEELIKGISSKK